MRVQFVANQALFCLEKETTINATSNRRHRRWKTRGQIRQQTMPAEDTDKASFPLCEKTRARPQRVRQWDQQPTSSAIGKAHHGQAWQWTRAGGRGDIQESTQCCGIGVMAMLHYRIAATLETCREDRGPHNKILSMP